MSKTTVRSLAVIGSQKMTKEDLVTKTMKGVVTEDKNNKTKIIVIVVIVFSILLVSFLIFKKK